MAKEEQKSNMYLLTIVGIVAVVGIVVLVLNAGTGATYVSDSDFSGEATMAKSSPPSFLVKKIIVGYGKDAITLSATDCTGCDSSQNCCCDANAENCACCQGG